MSHHDPIETRARRAAMAVARASRPLVEHAPDLDQLRSAHARRRTRRRLATTFVAVPVLLALVAVIPGLRSDLPGLWIDDITQPDGAPDQHETEATEPATETEPPTVQSLTGLWRSPSNDREWTASERRNCSSVDLGAGLGHLVVHLRSDGTFAKWQAIAGFDPVGSGSYTVDGTTIVFTNHHPDVLEDTWTWEVTISAEGGQLHAVVPTAYRLANVSDPPQAREDPGFVVAAGTTCTFVRVPSPFAHPRGSGASPASEQALAGSWLLENSSGGGLWLNLHLIGTYTLTRTVDRDRDLDDPYLIVDAGTFEVGEGGTLTFTSGRRSDSCAQGDTWVWEGVQLIPGSPQDIHIPLTGHPPGLTAVVSRNDCTARSLDADLRWVQVFGGDDSHQRLPGSGQ